MMIIKPNTIANANDKFESPVKMTNNLEKEKKTSFHPRKTIKLSEGNSMENDKSKRSDTENNTTRTQHRAPGRRQSAGGSRQDGMDLHRKTQAKHQHKQYKKIFREERHQRTYRISRTPHPRRE